MYQGTQHHEIVKISIVYIYIYIYDNFIIKSPYFAKYNLFMLQVLVILQYEAEKNNIE